MYLGNKEFPPLESNVTFHLSISTACSVVSFVISLLKLKAAPPTVSDQWFKALPSSRITRGTSLLFVNLFGGIISLVFIILPWYRKYT